MVGLAVEFAVWFLPEGAARGLDIFKSAILLPGVLVAEHLHFSERAGFAMILFVPCLVYGAFAWLLLWVIVRVKNRSIT
jgi:hypothetical protein